MKQETLTFSADCTVCIVGLGLMGGSFAKRFKQIGVKRIIAIDTDEAVLNMASADGVADEILSTGTAALAEAQIILFCLPLAATARFIVENGKFFVPGQVITDIIGIKQDSVEDVSNLLPDYVDYVPAHPMAGREGRGYAMSRAEIFEGANYIIVPTADSSTAAVRMVKDMAVALGCSAVPVVTAAEHDRRIAYTSFLPHILATSLVNSHSMNAEMKYFVAGGFRDTTRVADINAALWTCLLLSGRESVLTEIEHFKAALAKVEAALEREDGTALERFLTEAAKRRRDVMHGKRTC